MTRVALVWHMHQPYYEDAATGEHILPWVRLHAIKDYYGMIALLREFPDVHVTFNLAPSLMLQLESFVERRAKDRYLELSLKPAAELTGADIDFIAANFFHAHRGRMIDPYPRYAEIHSRCLAGAARRLSLGELRDLQVWHKLVWIDPYYQNDPRIQRLFAQGRGFSEEDKHTLADVEREILARIAPEYRAAVQRGQIEASTSPFYHPILPLLCDSDIYRESDPHGRQPRRRFRHPEDAAEQLARARSYHEALFGAAPVGVWPSEGSVSDEAAALIASQGFRWLATDETLLARSLGVALTRDGEGRLMQPETLYRAYRLATAGGEVRCLFRDRLLSDLIGFTYASRNADAAADDFVARLVDAGRRFTARTGGDEAVIPVILDGENAWETYPDQGRPFLRALYKRLSGHAELRTVTVDAACASTTALLPRLAPGSWVDGSFYIWIGHQDDQRAWAQLADARQALASVESGLEPAARARAYEEILIAEGSDWFWWYGDDHSSSQDEEFDELFRRRLRNAYLAMGLPPPDELFMSNITARPVGSDVLSPVARVAPTLDGEVTSYFEWLGAGRLDGADRAGAMHQASAATSLISAVYYGFGADALYVRLDASRRVDALLAAGYEVRLMLSIGDGIQVHIKRERERAEASIWRRDAQRIRVRSSATRAMASAGLILEAAAPLADLGVAAGDSFGLMVILLDANGQEIERRPSQPATVTAPGERFEVEHWSV